MEDKIREYVNYQFRFDNREDIEEMKEEIIANLIDRYHEYLKEGKSKQEAYIEAIKQMGNFANVEEDIDNEFSLKPSIADVSLVVAMILSVFGLLLLFMNFLAGAITTVISIVCFSSASYYMYANSQYIRKNYMDIEKHNIILKKIFKNVKTCFIFWAISLSIILTYIIISILVQLSLINIIDDFNYESIGSIIEVVIILFILILTVFIVLFINLYHRIMKKYYYLTGEMPPRSYLTDSIKFIKGDNVITFSKIINAKRLLSIYGLLYYLFVMLDSFWIELNDHASTGGALLLHIFSVGPIWIRLIAIITSFAFLIVNIIATIKNKISHNVLIISHYIFFVGIYLFFLYIIKYLTPLTDAITFKLILGIVIFTIIIITRLIYNKVKAKK